MPPNQINLIMTEFKKYSFTKLKGVHDLKPVFLFVGNSQGDESRTNSLIDYKGSGGYLSCVLDKTPNNQGEVDQIVINNTRWNNDYITKLKKSGEYLDNYEVEVSVEIDPEYDRYIIGMDPCSDSDKSSKAYESYRFDIFKL